MRARAFAAVALLAAAACSVTDSDERWDPRPGELLADVSQPAITMPAQVKVGEEFTMTVITQGDACYRQGGTEVSIAAAERTAEVWPFDRVNVEAEGCARILRTFQHTARLRFTTAGDATVRVHVVKRTNGVPDQAVVPVSLRVVD